MISKTLKISLIGLAMVSFSATEAQEVTQEKKVSAEKAFEKMDTDSNGAISLEEYKAVHLKDEAKTTISETDIAIVEKSFMRIDTDQNGSLNLEEFKTNMENGRKG